MKFLPILALMALLFSEIEVLAQNETHLSTAFESILSSENKLPFWISTNQNGKYVGIGKATQLIEIDGSFLKENLFKSSVDFEIGTHLISSYSKQFDNQVNELYGKAYYRGWKIEGGWFREANYFDGISSTNGNIDRSNNARPYPKIRFGTNEFIPFLFWKNWFSFKAEYDEGWLNDERIVEGTRLHHKSLYAKVNFTKTSNLSIGLNHYVMWGGLSPSPNIGQMPDSFKDYFTYITGSIGGEDFPITDQFNVAGNQFGSYHIQYNHSFSNFTLSFYVNHMFEDHSGMELKNIRDNLYGIYVKFNNSKILESIIYEHLYTLHQGGSVHVQGSTGLDNYYNHGVYHSGYSYQGRMMVSPLFAPYKYTAEGIMTGIQNNRIVMHHVGIKGSLHKNIKWDTKFTYTQNYGTYRQPFEPIRNQFSSVLNLSYQSPSFPVDVALSIAADVGDLYENNLGGMFRISKTF
ncbi:MAG: hypothetical protein PF541_16105 [Prolixibacteraceae bacterium]|jgi:hypothetical protein|nr:hypothetical protein [Prolixibacteraceae bacterium]